MKTVTISGVDSSNSFDDYTELFKKYPFLEFGVLFAIDSDKHRYPSLDWIWGFMENVKGRKSLHACPSIIFKRTGSTNAIRDGSGFIQVAMQRRDSTIPQVDRVQINVKLSELDNNDLMYVFAILNTNYFYSLNNFFKGNIILQCNDFNYGYFKLFHNMKKLDVLIDNSLGNGVNGLSKYVVKSYIDDYIPEKCNIGLAGGLSASNVLDTLAEVSQDVQWVDAETNLRDENDNFSLDKADAFLSTLEDWAYTGKF